MDGDHGKSFATNPERPFGGTDVKPKDFERWYPKDRSGELTEGRFEIGLVLAGAVSAGAYTAGVLDFLFEALDRWSEAKQRGDDVPSHEVVLRVVAGASAGGINGAIAAAVCRYKFPHGPKADNPFYAAWVKGADIDKLLDPGDLEGDGIFRSVLNCDSLVEIADAAIGYTAESAPRARDRWLADGFRLMLTLTNLSGVSYAVRLAGGSGLAHQMTLHRDHIAFQVPLRKVSANVPPDVVALPTANSTTSPPWRSLSTSALATSAFPLALEPREIWRVWTDYDYRFAYVNRKDEKINAEPWPIRTSGKPDPHKFLSVDGGAMNNEPFELARTALSGSQASNPREAHKANRAIIMVDPFSDFAESPEALDPSVIAVAGRLLGAFKSQARFKHIDLTLAEAEDVYSRFLIAPSRIAKGGPKRGKAAIASGGLGGFLGFFAEPFRHHDFMLGRANCRAFLRDWFALPDGDEAKLNPIFEDGRWSSEHRDAGSPYRSRTRPDRLQVIPLVDGLHEDAVPEDWPAKAYPGYSATKRQIKKRLGVLYPALRRNLFEQMGANLLVRWGTRAYLWPVWTFVARPRLLRLARSNLDEAARQVENDAIS